MLRANLGEVMFLNTSTICTHCYLALGPAAGAGQASCSLDIAAAPTYQVEWQRKGSTNCNPSRCRSIWWKASQGAYRFSRRRPIWCKAGAGFPAPQQRPQQLQGSEGMRRTGRKKWTPRLLMPRISFAGSSPMGSSMRFTWKKMALPASANQQGREPRPLYTACLQ